MPDTRDADALIVAVAAGDARALTELWKGYGGAVRNLGARFMGNTADGDDIAQMTFQRIWQSAARFDPSRGSGKAWLFTIARNVSRDRLRRRRIAWIAGLDTLDSEPPDDQPDADDRLVDREALATLQGLLLELPDAQRMALLLASVGDLETPEIAGILGRSRGAVEQLIVRARRTLRTRMEERGHAR